MGREVFRVERDGLAAFAARAVGDLLRSAIEGRGVASFAVSGGRTPWAMLEALAGADLDWERVEIFQVDERVAPADDQARNLIGLRRSLCDHVPAVLHPMPVEAKDLTSAVSYYDVVLPDRIDVVHLGLGTDGHTASLVPGDAILDATDVDVALTSSPYQGHRRMSLTFPKLNRAGHVVWLVSGADKAEMLDRMLAADSSIPAGMVTSADQTVVTDIQAPHSNQA